MTLALNQGWWQLTLWHLHWINLDLLNLNDILLLFCCHFFTLCYGVDVGNIILYHTNQSCWQSPASLKVPCVSVSAQIGPARAVV